MKLIIILSKDYTTDMYPNHYNMVIMVWESNDIYDLIKIIISIDQLIDYK